MTKKAGIQALASPNQLTPQDIMLIEKLMVPGTSINRACADLGISVNQWHLAKQRPVFIRELQRRMDEYEDLMAIKFDARLASRHQRIVELERLYESIPDSSPDRRIKVKVKIDVETDQVWNGDVKEAEGKEFREEQWDVLVMKSNAPADRDWETIR